MKDGLKRLLCDRYQNDINSFIDNFVHPTQSLLSGLQEEVSYDKFFFFPFMITFVIIYN